MFLYFQSVRFRTETDAKEHFPTNQTFQDFRKQRDQFYEILRDWQQPAGRAGHTDVFGPRVSRLLSLQTHPVNMLHFAQLFQSQVANTILSKECGLCLTKGPSNWSALALYSGGGGQNGSHFVQNHSKSKQNGRLFVWISNGLVLEWSRP